MKYLWILMFSFALNTCHSQDSNIKGYYFKDKEVSHIMLLSKKVGYYYSGPDLLIDEVFTYKLDGNSIIRTFHEKYSLKKRVDTLIAYHGSLKGSDGLLFREVNDKRKTKLIEQYIIPSIDVGYYKNFLKIIDSL